jgi:hypothetical protein
MNKTIFPVVSFLFLLTSCLPFKTLNSTTLLAQVFRLRGSLDADWFCPIVSGFNTTNIQQVKDHYYLYNNQLHYCIYSYLSPGVRFWQFHC